MEQAVFTEFKAEVVKRLETLGYKFQDNETQNFMLKFLTEKVENTILNETNQAEVPEGLHHVFIDMVCGEFLWQLKSMVLLTGEEMDAVVTSIKVGDTQTSFDTKSSPQALYEALTKALMNDGKKEFIRYRKLVW